MNIKLISAALVTLTLSGCANTIRYSGTENNTIVNGASYKVEAKLEHYVNPGFFVSDIRNDIFLYINDILTIRGPLHTDESGQLQGFYNSHPVMLDCNKANIFTPTQCMVHIDNKLASTIKLTPSYN